MNIAVVSYSLTGNNEALAGGVARELQAEHIKISEPRQRTTATVVLDMIFNRIPKVKPSPASLEKYDLILFVGPVWMGQAASPFRTYLKYFGAHPQQYAFASISGGAINTNPKLAGDLVKRAGREPKALIDLHIADLLPSGPKPTMKDTSAYRINEDDLKKLTDTVSSAVRKITRN